MPVIVLFFLMATVFVFVSVVRLLDVRMLVFRFARGMSVGMLVFVRVRMLVLVAVRMRVFRSGMRMLMLVLVFVRVLVLMFVRVIVILLLAHGLPLSAHATLQLTDRMQTPRDAAIRTIVGVSGAIAPPLPHRVAQSSVRPRRRAAFRVS